MPTEVSKLFAGQGTGRTDGWTKWRLYASPSGEHKNKMKFQDKFNRAWHVYYGFYLLDLLIN